MAVSRDTPAQAKARREAMSRQLRHGEPTNRLHIIMSPDQEGVDGKSEGWVIRLDPESQKLVDRKIAITHDAKHTDTLLRADTPVAIRWAAFESVVQPVTITPVPGRQNIDGKSESYLFHRDAQGRLMYRTISIEHDPAHGDRIVVKDRPVVDWWPSLKAIGHLAEILSVPGRQGFDGKSESWVFHYTSEAQLLYRKISVGHDAAHADVLVTEDRPIDGWWKALNGIDYLVTIVPVPGRQGIDGKSEYYVFHRDTDGRLLYRKISITHDAAHTDILVTEDRPVADWWPSLNGVS
ncbi:hypothetical protein [Streptomyces lasiicapitis]|uniref:Outer membrane lipoprotein-sorting protein n=1 Tax=Streptomyces lasiicapitis TaxID=1923961 RepID=A0ABQ2MWA7_9ACTN|nr:hypothetical protein [Streptomyces lasiicapitis]GGO59285.1 hypothetical protein GCM10012286_80540 [Streptomyces lasiicapitis]